MWEAKYNGVQVLVLMGMSLVVGTLVAIYAIFQAAAKQKEKNNGKR